MNGRVVASERQGHSIFESQESWRLLLISIDILYSSQSPGCRWCNISLQFPRGCIWMVLGRCLRMIFLWLTVGLLHRNAALSIAAGNATIWKPSDSTPLCSIAVTNIVSRVLEENGIPGAVASLVTGGRDVGSAIAESREVELGQFHLFQMHHLIIMSPQCRLLAVNMLVKLWERL